MGILLPCNVVVQQAEGCTEISVVEPLAVMASIHNPELAEVAKEISQKLRRVLDAL
jgi:uncharacterized protein (DUF302 family)